MTITTRRSAARVAVAPAVCGSQPLRRGPSPNRPQSCLKPSLESAIALERMLNHSSLYLESPDSTVDASEDELDDRFTPALFLFCGGFLGGLGSVLGGFGMDSGFGFGGLGSGFGSGFVFAEAT